MCEASAALTAAVPSARCATRSNSGAASSRARVGFRAAQFVHGMPIHLFVSGLSALSALPQHSPSLRTLPSPTRTTRIAAVVDPDGLDALLPSIDASVDASAAAEATAAAAAAAAAQPASIAPGFPLLPSAGLAAALGFVAVQQAQRPRGSARTWRSRAPSWLRAAARRRRSRAAGCRWRRSRRASPGSPSARRSRAASAAAPSSRRRRRRWRRRWCRWRRRRRRRWRRRRQRRRRVVVVVGRTPRRVLLRPARRRRARRRRCARRRGGARRRVGRGDRV